jgi:UDP-N-acetylmuramyl pentapeptide phosphotransferase/UDP-N-acetylglucosamine-1-phosphate transferase
LNFSLVLFAFVGCLISFGVSLALLPRLRSVALALVSERSAHREPTPQGGGVGLVAAALAGALFVSFGASKPLPVLALAGGLALLALIGFLDDRKSLAAAPRLAAQIAAALAFLAALPVDRGIAPFDWPIALDRLVVAIAIVWMINLTNFIDGSDLISVAHAGPALLGAMVIAAGGAATFGDLPLLWAACLGGVLGFALLNLPPARLFLGDCGSYPLGLMLAAFVVMAGLDGRFWLGAALVAYPVTDATVTLVRRLANGHRPHEAHSDHYYQRARRRGWSAWAVAALAAAPGVAALVLLAVAVPEPAIFAVSLGLSAGACLAFNGGARQLLAAP